jgi:hypothetical protein
MSRRTSRRKRCAAKKPSASGIKSAVAKACASAAKRVMVQIAPNRFAAGNRDKPPPEMVLCNVVPNGDGLYRLEPRTWERFERVNSDLSRKLGLGGRTDTLRRLIRGGFVGGARVAPKLYTLNLESYWAHYERCAEDPNYWINPKVRAEYWTAI